MRQRPHGHLARMLETRELPGRDTAMTPFRMFARRALLLAGVVACAGSHAQAPGAPTPSAAPSAAADRAQRESERTLYWIRILADKPGAKATERKAAIATAKEPQSASSAAAGATEARLPGRAKAASAAPVGRSNAPSLAATAVETPRPAAGKGDKPAAVAVSDDLGARAAAPASMGVLPGSTAVQAPAVPAPAPGPEAIAAPEIDEPDPGLIMTRSADPKFPVAAMHRLRQGEVEVLFQVNADGQVEAVSVVKTTSPTLNNAALDAVRQWQFRPTPHGHTAVVDLAFNLDS